MEVWHAPLPSEKRLDKCIDTCSHEESGGTVFDERFGQALSQHFAHENGQAIGDDHPERTAQPHPEKTLVLTGERHGGQHRLIPQFREEEGEPDGQQQAETGLGRVRLICQRVPAEGPEANDDERQPC